MFVGFGALEGTAGKVASPIPGINVNSFESILKSRKASI